MKKSIWTFILVTDFFRGIRQKRLLFWWDTIVLAFGCLKTRDVSCQTLLVWPCLERSFKAQIASLSKMKSCWNGPLPREISLHAKVDFHLQKQSSSSHKHCAWETRMRFHSENLFRLCKTTYTTQISLEKEQDINIMDNNHMHFMVYKCLGKISCIHVQRKHEQCVFWYKCWEHSSKFSEENILSWNSRMVFLQWNLISDLSFWSTKGRVIQKASLMCSQR